MLQKTVFKENNDRNFKVCLCKEDIAKVSVDPMVNVANETIFADKGTGGAIHEAAESKLLRWILEIKWLWNGWI